MTTPKTPKNPLKRHPEAFKCPSCGQSIDSKAIAGHLGRQGGSTTGQSKSRGGSEYYKKIRAMRMRKIDPSITSNLLTES